eukprot:TRINITY_DN8171_c0_g1_i1.p1 TRINITY_DN8171_c0_g1~~TRINITY_DN8171_c0_g1_i1.p1  ORF type:complete len:589 (-),score=117.38 TRINITY_DN8171_c0_g1_i1:59-1825(-)
MIAFVDLDYVPPFTKEENYEELFKKYYEWKLLEDKQKLPEFIYDQATGFYLHTPTEMYYDSNSAVYYDPKKRRCYQYNYTSNSYDDCTYEFMFLFAQHFGAAEMVPVPPHLKLIRLNELDQETMVHYVVGRDSELTSLKPPKKLYKMIYKNIANNYYEYMMSTQQPQDTQAASEVENTTDTTTVTKEPQETATDTSHMTEEQLSAYYHMYAEYYRQYYAATTEVPLDDTSTVPPDQSHDTMHTVDRADDVPPEEPSPFPALEALIKASKDVVETTEQPAESDTAETAYSTSYQYMLEQTTALEHAYAAAAAEQEETPRLSTWLGRNMKNDIPLDDAAVSNYHCEVMYEEIYNSHYFFIKDWGSTNGTFLNETRVSSAHQPSTKVLLRNGDVLRIGPFKFKVKYHFDDVKAQSRVIGPSLPNQQPVPQPKPAEVKKTSLAEKLAILRSLTREQRQRLEPTFLQRQYRDRAAERREHFPDQGPVSNPLAHAISADNDVPLYPTRDRSRFYANTKMQPSSLPSSSRSDSTTNVAASLDTPISADNVGNQILQKMGWKEGTGLGRQGIVEPIRVEARQGMHGLGFAPKYAKK